MQTIKIRNAYNYDFDKQVKELPVGVSMTIPNQTLPLKELLNRFTRGQEVPTLQPVYNDPNIDPFFEKMDGVEKAAYAKTIKESIAIAQEQNAKIKAQAEKVKMTEEIKKSLAESDDVVKQSGTKTSDDATRLLA